jgi:hypothetical protein
VVTKVIVSATITLIGKDYGPYTWKIEREHSFNGQLNTAASYMLVCPGCQRIWAKHIIEGHDLLYPRAQFCDMCNIVPDGWHPVPGSLLIEEGWGVIDDSLLAAMPADLLEREYNLHTKALDNGFINSHADWPRRALAIARG